MKIFYKIMPYIILLIFLNSISFGQKFLLDKDFGVEGLNKYILPDNKLFIRGLINNSDTLNAIIFGWKNSDYKMGLSKLNDKGDFYSDFGNNGIHWRSDLSQYALDGAVKINNTEHVIFSNRFDDNFLINSFISRMKNITPDPNFGYNGELLLDIAPEYLIFDIEYFGEALYVCGFYFDSNNLNKGFICKISLSGIVDSTFGNNGYVLLNEVCIINDIIIDENSIYVGGAKGDGNISEGLVAKYDIHGNPDLSFANNGKLILQSLSDRKEVTKIIINSDNIMLFGQESDAGFISNKSDIFLSKIDKSGESIASFGNNGIINFNFATEGLFPRSCQRLGDNIILTGNYFYNDLQEFTGIIFSVNEHGEKIDTSYISIPDSMLNIFGSTVINDRLYLFGSYNDKNLQSTNGIVVKLIEDISASSKVEKAHKFEVYYNNIVNDFLKLSTKSTDQFSINLFNQNGKKITDSKFLSNTSLNLVDLSSGIYFFTLSNNIQTQTYRFIKI